MKDTTVIHLGTQAMMLGVKLAAPTLLTALAIGFAISLFQSATQIQEFTLASCRRRSGSASRSC